MKVCELYNMQDIYDCETNDEAKNCFNQLRNKIGYLALNSQGRNLSERQCITAHNAMKRIKKKEYMKALCAVYDFLHNYGENEHELSSAEFVVLDILLLAMGE